MPNGQKQDCREKKFVLHWQKVKLRKGCRTMEKEQALQALLDQVVRQGDFIGVSALYLRDGKQLAYAQAGMADRERGIPFARDTICRVFSMSKPITAFAVMKLWEDGKLDLDAPVAAYLPEFGDAEHTNLTIRQLLCMTSGYGYNDNDSVQSAGLGRLYDEISESFTKGGQRTTRQVIAEMAKLPLLYRPGKGWRYGVSADILAAAVEAASGMNYRDFLKQNLLDPLEMVDTDFMCRKPSVAGLPKRMILIPAQRCPMW